MKSMWKVLPVGKTEEEPGVKPRTVYAAMGVGGVGGVGRWKKSVWNEWFGMPSGASVGWAGALLRAGAGAAGLLWSATRRCCTGGLCALVLDTRGRNRAGWQGSARSVAPL